MSIQIGCHKLSNKLILAPMAGVTDQPFRKLCRKYGAGMAVSEMVGANTLFAITNSKTNNKAGKKTLRRANHSGESEPKSVQIVGADPKMLAFAAKYNEDQGAQIIDINMGCPAKKVCNMLSGSALLRDESLVKDILDQTVNSVSIPVTLKIRTGWDKDNKNAVKIAKIAEQSGIKALSIHGRTRSCFFKGEAEYETISEVKKSVSIPIIANGDITTPEKAKYVLEKTKADAVMIGRAAQGRPWIFREIDHYLNTGELLQEPPLTEIRDLLLGHLDSLYDFYGEYGGTRMARKHVSWYSKGNPKGAKFRNEFNRLETAKEQIESVNTFFDWLIDEQ